GWWSVDDGRLLVDLTISSNRGRTASMTARRPPKSTLERSTSRCERSRTSGSTFGSSRSSVPLSRISQSTLELRVAAPVVQQRPTVVRLRPVDGAHDDGVIARLMAGDDVALEMPERVGEEREALLTPAVADAVQPVRLRIGEATRERF